MVELKDELVGMVGGWFGMVVKKAARTIDLLSKGGGKTVTDE